MKCPPCTSMRTRTYTDMTHEQLTKSWNVRSLKDKVRTISRLTTLGLHSLEYTLLKTFEKSLPQANYHHAGRAREKGKKEPSKSYNVLESIVERSVARLTSIER